MSGFYYQVRRATAGGASELLGEYGKYDTAVGMTYWFGAGSYVVEVQA